MNRFLLLLVASASWAQTGSGTIQGEIVTGLTGVTQSDIAAPDQLRPDKAVVLSVKEKTELADLDKAAVDAKKAADETKSKFEAAKARIAKVHADSCKHPTEVYMEWAHYCNDSRFLYSPDYGTIFLEKPVERNWNAMTSLPIGTSVK